MKFWGVEVKSGEPLEVQCGDAFILHLSQASLGDCKKDKGNGSVCLYVKVDDKKLVLGTLSSEKIPQLQLDLVFDRDFQLSHNGKNGSVYFIGYKVPQAEYPFSVAHYIILSLYLWQLVIIFPFLSLQGCAPFSHASEIKPAKEEKEKPSSSGTKKVKIVEPIKDDSSDEESDDSSDEDDDLSDDDDQTDNDKGKLIKAAGTSDDDDDDDEDEDSDEEETDEEDVIEKKAKKDSTSKKRSDPETTTPVPNKKAKMVTPQKTAFDEQLLLQVSKKLASTKRHHILPSRLRRHLPAVILNYMFASRVTGKSPSFFEHY
ncbi:Histone deacetylase HDT1 [Linum perenne]